MRIKTDRVKIEDLLPRISRTCQISGMLDLRDAVNLTNPSVGF